MITTFNGDVSIRSATRSDMHQIARLHRKSFRGFFLTELGLFFLIRYYSIVLEYKKGILLVAKNSDGRLVGFVAGFLEPGKFYVILKKRRISLAISVMPSLLARPSRLIRILSTYRGIPAQDLTKDSVDDTWCELSSIAVDPLASGCGIGKLLAKELINKATQMGACLVYLSTDAEGNNQTNLFYRKIGFRLHKTYEGYRERKMNEYRIIISKSVS